MDNLKAPVALYYNFARIHQTLRVMPAMQGPSRIPSVRHSWSNSDLVL